MQKDQGKWTKVRSIDGWNFLEYYQGLKKENRKEWEERIGTAENVMETAIKKWLNENHLDMEESQRNY